MGAHAGLLGCFAIAEVGGQRDTLYLETHQRSWHEARQGPQLIDGSSPHM
jgi:hypothetical protein